MEFRATCEATEVSTTVVKELDESVLALVGGGCGETVVG